jgi:hypothetical protein
VPEALPQIEFLHFPALFRCFVILTSHIEQQPAVPSDAEGK